MDARPLPAVLYHCAPADRLDGIMAEEFGLVPGMEPNHEDSDPELVYLCQDPALTWRWVAGAAVVLAIDTVRLKAERFGEDRILKHFPGGELHWTYRGRIPPNALSVHEHGQGRGRAPEMDRDDEDCEP